jgi:rsbT co-antagonist protein RsbR
MTESVELAEIEAEISAVEREIAETEQFLTLVFDHCPHGVCIAMPDGSLKVNPAGAAITGSATPPSDADARGVAAWAEQYGLFLEDGKTPHPTSTLPVVRALAGETVRNATMRIRTQKRPDAAWLEVSARPLADGTAVAIFRDVTPERMAQDTRAARRQELAAREAQNAELVDRLRLTLDALSTPVLEVGPGILAVPVIGVVDTQRGATMSEKILSEVMRTKANHVVIDLTGVAIIDTSTADRILKLGTALRFLGAECVVSGIQPAVAQTLVAIGVDISVMVPRRDLQHALDYCIQRAAQQRAGASDQA